MNVSLHQLGSVARTQVQEKMVAASPLPGEVFVFWLPAPPSVNGLFRNVARDGRPKTIVYKQWQADASRPINRPVWFEDASSFELRLVGGRA